MKKIIILLLALVLALTAFTACADNKTDDALQAARDYLHAMYKDDPEMTTSSYTVDNVVTIDGVSFNVVWSLEITSGSAEDVTLTVDESAKQTTVNLNGDATEDTVYVLKGTISDASGNTKEVTFNHTLPKFKELTWAEYIAKSADEAVIVKGVVSAIIAKSNGSSYNCIYVQDNDGGYYVYSMTTDPLTDDKLEVGMTVRVRGVKDIYSGTHEIKSATVEILDSNKTDVTATDFTEIFKNAKSLKDSKLTAQQGLLVTIKGVEVKAQDDDTTNNGYYKFQLGELTTYVRISSSTCPLSKAEQTQFKADNGEHTGWTANVTGLVSIYNDAFYLTPATVDAFEYVSLPEKDDAGKVAFEKENLSLPTAITENTTLTLSATGAGYKDVTITWTSDNPCAVVADGKLVVTLPEAEATVKVVATLTSGSVTDTKEFTIKVDAAPTDVYIAKPITEVVTDKPFKFALYQAKLGKTLYFTGEKSGNFFATTDKADKAVDVYVEAVEQSGYRLYFKDGETKKYIEIYEYTTGKAGVHFTDAPTTIYTWNSELNIFVANVAGSDRYLGTYNDYATISASATSFITGENAGNVGVSQFIAQLCTLSNATYVANKVTSAAEGTFKLVLNQANLGKVLYFAGEVNSSEYLTTTDKVDGAADVVIAASGDGYTFKVGDKFIEVYENASQKVRIRLVDTATGVWMWNADLGTFTYTLSNCQSSSNNDTYYLGTYNTYNTISASKISYISGENASNVGKTQFPAYVSTLAVKELVSTVVTAPAEGTAYKFALYQANLGKTLYFTGEKSGNFFATTDKLSKAVDVYVEAVTGGYRLYFKDGETKKYIEIYEYTTGKAGVHFTDAPTTIYTWNSELNIFVANVAGSDRYLGTYNDYATISASATSYITGDNASNVGVSQFIAQLVLVSVAD